MTLPAYLRRTFTDISAIAIGIQMVLLVMVQFPTAEGNWTRGIGEPLDVPYGGTPITIDGTSSTGEWEDAAVVLSEQMGTERFTLKAKEDGEMVLLFFSLDPDPEFAVLDFYMDPGNGSGLSTGAFLVDLWSSLPPREYDWMGAWTEVTPSGWNGTKGVDGIEMGFEYGKLSIGPGEKKDLRIAIRAISAVTYEQLLWPAGYDNSDPATWGSMTSSDLWDQPNAPPTLRNGTGPPSIGFTDDTFHYSIIFEDPDGDIPDERNIVIDGAEHEMDWIQDTGVGILYGYATQLSPGDHGYHFDFSDGEFPVRFPPLGELDGPMVYVPNSAPTLDRAIPNGTYWMDEGQNTGFHIIDLEGFFSDDRDDGSLEFSVIYEESPEVLGISVDGRYLNAAQKEIEWFGSLSFQVEARDHGIPGLPVEDHRLATRSNVFSIEVRPVNDGPQIVFLNGKVSNDTVMVECRGPRGAVEDSPFTIDVRAFDADTDMDPLERLSFSFDGPALVSRGGGRDNATFVLTPEDRDVGLTTWNFTVEDRFGTKDSMALIVETQNVNDRPIIVSCEHNGVTYPSVSGRVVFGDGLSAVEDERFFLRVIARDDDLMGTGDDLTFELTTPRDDVVIDPWTGDLSFLPGQEDVGRKTIGVSVTDRAGARDQVEIVIDVENVNDAPSIIGVYSSSGEMRFREGSDDYLLVDYVDSDIGIDPEERTSVLWRSDRSGAMGEGDRLYISDLEAGTYNVTVTVTDGRGAMDDLSFTVIVDENRTGRMDAIVLGLIIGASVLVAALGLGLFSLLSFTFFSRLKEKSILDNLNRRSIFDAIRRNSGIHFMALSEEVGLAKGVLAHHLNILEKNEYIKSLQDSKYRRFYPFDEKIEFKLALTTVQQAILYTVKQDPGISQTGISARTGKSKMVINYHIKILKDVGLLSLERNGRETNCFPTSAAMDLS